MPSSAKLPNGCVESIAYIGYGIYVGKKEAATAELLEAEGIRNVLTFSGKKTLNRSPLDVGSVDAHKVVIIEDTDQEDIGRAYDENDVGGFIEQATRDNSTIFVHCDKGEARSVTNVILYLIERQDHNVAQGFKRFLDGPPMYRRLSISPRAKFIEAMYDRQDKNPAVKDAGGERIKELPGKPTIIDLAQRKINNENFAKDILAKIPAKQEPNPRKIKCSEVFQKYAKEAPIVVEKPMNFD